MKHRKTIHPGRFFFCASTILITSAFSVRGNAQPPGVKTFNPFRVTFTRRWTEKLADRAKLMDILPDSKRSGLALTAETADRDLIKRRLLMTHWDGFHFTTDASADFLGATPDTLLAGKFRDVPPPTTPTPGSAATPPKKPKKTIAPPSKAQIITNEGVYEWDGKTLNRLFNAPPNVKLALEIENRPDRFTTGSGDQTAQYILTDVGTKALLNFDAPIEAAGFARSGIGAQDLPQGAPSADLTSGVRYLQSYWKNRNRWIIGLVHANNGAGDTLVVYAPKFSGREKSFWQSPFEDFEEVWRSGTLAGHVLDVRVGDPKNEGAAGILVLTSENNDNDRILTFFAPVLNGAGK